MTTQNLFLRAKAAHEAEIATANERQRAHVEGKRIEVIEATRVAAFKLLGVTINEDDITLIHTREPNHPNVFGETQFWFDGVLFCFLPWSGSWSVRANVLSTALGFSNLASLGEALMHDDFDGVTYNVQETDAEADHE